MLKLHVNIFKAHLLSPIQTIVLITKSKQRTTNLDNFNLRISDVDGAHNIVTEEPLYRDAIDEGMAGLTKVLDTVVEPFRRKALTFRPNHAA